MKGTSLLLPLALVGSAVGSHVASSSASGPPTPAELSRSFQDVIHDVAPAVVGIRAEQRGSSGRAAIGSAVVLREDGILVTNYHVVEGAESVFVLLDEDREVRARVRGVDSETDLAVLDIAGRSHPTAQLGGDVPPSVGEWVLALGNPFGLGQSVSAGIVSGLGRKLELPGVAYEDFIQTDAAINSGNSGGALVDLDGNVVGINGAKGTVFAGNVGLGFAIPAHLVREVVDEILLEGRVRRGWLGVEMREITAGAAQDLGLESHRHVKVTHVRPRGPAAEAGLLVDDVILRIGDHTPADLRDLLLAVARLEPGSRVPVEIWREGRRRSLAVSMGERDPREVE